MAIVAYASAHADPTNNPNVDKVVDLSAVSLPQSGLQLYGAAVDSANAGATFTWQWYVMAKPTGSSAALVSATVQNAVLNAVDTWGNVRLFLVATNVSTAETSSTDPLRAPSSAFVTVRVLSASQGLQKPAAGERNWFDDVAVWPEKIEALGVASAAGFGAHKIVDHSDVVDATGADLEVLTGGGYAVDPDTTTPNTPNSFGHSLLHKHYGSDVDIATAALPGVIYLDSAYSGPAATPRAMTNDYFLMTAHVRTTWTDVGTFEAIAQGYKVGGAVQPLVWFTLPPGIATYTVEDIILVFSRAPYDSTAYTFELVQAPLANTAAGRKAWNVVAVAGSSWTLPALDAEDRGRSWGASFLTGGGTAGFALATAGKGPIGLRCTASPAALELMGQGLSITIVGKRA